MALLFPLMSVINFSTQKFKDAKLYFVYQCFTHIKTQVPDGSAGSQSLLLILFKGTSFTAHDRCEESDHVKIRSKPRGFSFLVYFFKNTTAH